MDKLGKTEPASFCDGASANYGVDERAEGGLISRNIKLTSIVPLGATVYGASGTRRQPGLLTKAKRTLREPQYERIPSPILVNLFRSF